MKKISQFALFFPLVILFGFLALQYAQSPSMSRYVPQEEKPPQPLPKPPPFHQLKQFVQRQSALKSPVRSRVEVRNYLQMAWHKPPIKIQNPILFKKHFIARRRANLELSQHTRNLIRKNYPSLGTWFSDSFFSSHHFTPYYQLAGTNWWWSPNWRAICDWLPLDWSYPIYYDSLGNGIKLPQEYAYFPYSGTALSPYYTPPAALQQPHQGLVAQQTSSEWLPLGVFALGKTARAAGYSNLFIQLAMNRLGELAGSYYNATTGRVQELDGVVDKTTQAAAWLTGDIENAPIAQTGLYNLTQDVTPIQLVFSDGSKQSWVLVRLAQ